MNSCNVQIDITHMLHLGTHSVKRIGLGFIPEKTKIPGKKKKKKQEKEDEKSAKYIYHWTVSEQDLFFYLNVGRRAGLIDFSRAGAKNCTRVGFQELNKHNGSPERVLNSCRAQFHFLIIRSIRFTLTFLSLSLSLFYM